MELTRGPIDDAREALACFVEPEGLELSPLRHGHIHSSFVVRDVSADITPQPRYLLQALNTQVFQHPHRVASNLQVVTEHLRQRVAERGGDTERHCLELLPTLEGEPMARRVGPGLGEVTYWRLFRFVPASRSILQTDKPEEAFEAAMAVAQFQLDLEDLDPALLTEPIPHFHDTPRRFAALEAAIHQDSRGRVSQVGHEIEQLLRWRPFAQVLLAPQSRGHIPLRVAHNDAKISNVLFDAAATEALCVIDLDTVMPGLSLYDFGEMVRSMSYSLPEDWQHPEELEIDRLQLQAIRDGYLERAAALLNREERSLLLDAGKLMTLENAVRFLTDYLEGDVYFRVHHASQNLDRCRIQQTLLKALDGLGSL